MHIIFYETNATPRKVVEDDDDEDIENIKKKEPKENELENNKEEPLLEDLQRNED